MKSAKQSSLALAACSRREFTQRSALALLTLASCPVLSARGVTPSQLRTGAATRVFPLDRDWLFGGKFTPDAAAPEFNDAAST